MKTKISEINKTKRILETFGLPTIEINDVFQKNIKFLGLLFSGLFVPRKDAILQINAYIKNCRINFF